MQCTQVSPTGAFKGHSCRLDDAVSTTPLLTRQHVVHQVSLLARAQGANLNRLVVAAAGGEGDLQGGGDGGSGGLSSAME